VSALRAVPVGFGIQHARLHLAVLHRKGLVLELRARLPRGGMDQSFHTNPYEAAADAMSISRSTDVYVGVLPRTRESGGAGDVAPSHVLFVECDSSHSVDRMFGLNIPPNIVVRSSRWKAHGYWILKEPLDPKWLEIACKRMAWHLRGDMRATDAARILRVAGTHHHKTGRAEPTWIARWEGGNVDVGDLVGHLPDPSAPPVAKPRRPKLEDPNKDRLAAIPAEEYAPVLAGRYLSGHMMTCPFHGGGAERTPSFHVRGPNRALWYCHGCGEGSDIFGLAARLWGLNPNRDFPAIVKRLGGTFA
jgi:hypothetical protein